jgi:formate hydrogenlyase subunit 4
MEWGSANKLVIFLLLAVNVFVPWGGTFDFLGTSVAATLTATFLKLLLAAGVVALIESSMPKLRFFRLPELLFTSFALGVIALVIAVI